MEDIAMKLQLNTELCAIEALPVVMMMIAFITFKSSLVPLLEGL